MERGVGQLIARGRGPAIVALGVVAAGIAIGVLGGAASDVAVPVALLVLLIGASAIDLTVIPVLALAATLVQSRVLGGALSVSDFVLAAATCVSLFMLRGRGGLTLQPLLWAGTAYLAVTVPTLILNRYQGNYVEWGHELFLVLGSMIVGFVLGREGRAPAALLIYVLACAGIGIAAMYWAVVGFASSGMFVPVFLPGLHKNTIGGMLAAAVVIAVARPVWLGWKPRTAYLLAVLCGGGVLAAQSRQGIVGALVGIVIVAVRPRLRAIHRGRIAWLIGLGAVAVVAVAANVNDQLSSDNPFNSANQRLSWFDSSIRIWSQSPIFGVGMRWWYTDRFAERFQPPNAELEVLSTTGVVGLAGFLAMFAAASWLLLKMDPVYGTLGIAVVATRFVQAQFDIFWVAGQASVLWIVAGICYGVRERDRALGIDRVALAGIEADPPRGPGGPGRRSAAGPVVRRPVRPPVRTGTRPPTSTEA